jgi:rieske iron-sulfur protein
MSDSTTNNISRRAALTCAFGLGVGVAISRDPAFAQGDPASARPMEGDLLVRNGDATAKPLTVADVGVAAAPVSAWAMTADGVVRRGTRLNGLLLFRFAPDQLDDATRALSADGVVAYTSICTHAGCDLDDWRVDEQVMTCSCHSSVFDPKRGAKVVDGPAPRSLPALPLKTSDGRLVVAGSFTSRVGFESA